MRKPVIAIIDEDEGFVRRLEDYLSDSKKISVKISGFTSFERLEEYAFTSEVLFVIAGEGILEKYGEINFAPVIRICEDEGDEENDGIYRYKAGEYYVHRFMELSGLEQNSILAGNRGGANLIGIYSPIGRCFKTTFALTLGQILAKNHRVLYLNLESYSGFPDLFCEESVKNMSDMIYCFNNMSDEFRKHFSLMVKSINGLEYIKPVLAYYDLYEVDKTVWVNLLINLMSWGEYEYILLDLSDSLNGLYEILNMCRIIYTVIPKDEISRAKTNQYELVLKNCEKLEILEKTKKYDCPIFRNIPDNPGELLRSEMGGYVRELVRGDFAI